MEGAKAYKSNVIAVRHFASILIFFFNQADLYLG